MKTSPNKSHFHNLVASAFNPVGLAGALCGVAILLSLSACGGGDGDSPAPVPAPVPAPTPTPPLAPTPVPPPVAASTLVTSVPPDTYLAGDPRKEAYAYLNKQRGDCGWGLLKQDQRLDKAAEDHLNYLTVNKLFTHIQSAGMPGFTGATPTDRAVYRGYPGGAIENLAGPGGAVLAVHVLFTGVYHGAALLSANLDIGIATGEVTVVTPGSFTGSSYQRIAGDAVVTYPCEASALPLLKAGFEAPDPFAATGRSSTTFGHPIYVGFRLGNTVTVTDWTLTESASGRSLKTFTPPGLADGGVIRYVNPDEPLKAATSYTVRFRGTNNGVAVDKTWTFKTAADAK